ncbi:MAG TPA: urease accessory UreF family protein [Polyangiaceae bacterium]|nr:urease accessory UreF family protein [Polyangiaceae bacterium]
MTTLADVPLLRLLGLSSPALPIGAFAYSQGLEYAVEAGWVTDEPSAVEWICGVLAEPFAHLDLAMFVRFYGAHASGDTERVRTTSRELLAFRESRELEQEDVHLGRAIARVLVGHGVDAAKPYLDADDATGASLYALGATTWGIPLRSALVGYTYAWAEAQTGALSRLLPLGQIAVQRILWKVLEGAPSAVDVALSLDDDDIGAFAPSYAMASVLHETQYTRLFRS